MPDDGIKYLVLDRRDPDVNTTQFYVLSTEASPFGDAALIRDEPDRHRRQRKLGLHARKGRVTEFLKLWLRRKQRRGYVVRHRSLEHPSQGTNTALERWSI
jgi:predicted DNA-binding WGR domain protein